MRRISPRLKMTADMVREGASAADIGADHAYLAAYLIATGRCPHVLATDLRVGPLRNAAETLEKFSLADRLELRISDGLDEVSPDDAQDFIFAGMGGTLIAELLSRAPWLKDSSKMLVLQPMSHAEEVRGFLIENGFRIIEENACFDECRPYIAMRAQYAPDHSHGGDNAYKYLGELVKCSNEAATFHFTKLYIYLSQRADALARANLLPEEVGRINAVLPEILPYTRLQGS